MFLKIRLILCIQFISCACYSGDKLIDKIEKVRIQNNISAALVIIVDKNKIVKQAHLGTISWENKHQFSQENMFRIGSISKTFAGMLALKMHNAGLINLTQTLSHYVKNNPIKNDFPTEITLRQLLEHSAGLSDLSKAEWDFNEADRISLQQSLALKLGNHKSRWQPGLHSSYSNVGAAYLGLALEKAGGQSYEALMDDFVFEPLGMKSSTLFLNTSVKNRLITGYNTDGKTPINYWHNIYRPFAAMNTDAKDLVIFLQMLLNGGNHNQEQFLRKSDISRIQNPETTLSAKSGLTYGYGLGIYSWQANGHTFYGHGGDADGYLTRFGYNTESGLAYFIMINAFQHSALKQIKNLVEHNITKHLAKPIYPLRLKLSHELLTKYIGKYYKVTSRFNRLSQNNNSDFEIINQEGNLLIHFKNGRKQNIYAVNNSHFRYEEESVATMAFIEHQEHMYFQGDMGNFIKRQK
ncbi:MAG: serine hydrolase domain-containing protein [Marinicellaceae bacterium]